LQVVSTPEITPFWPGLGVGGILAGVVLKFYRDDRKASEDRYERLAQESRTQYSALAKESNERAAVIASDFRQIVEDNTRALTTLSEKISNISSGDVVTVRQLLEAIGKPIIRSGGGAD
jgi:hypothetical protein